MRRTAIITESSPAAARLAQEALEAAGVRVVAVAADGLSALRALKEHKPSILSLDLILPKLSGLQLAHAASQLPNPPLVIAISAVTARSRLAQAKAVGVRYYMLKPLNAEKLKAFLATGRYTQAMADVAAG